MLQYGPTKARYFKNSGTSPYGHLIITATLFRPEKKLTQSFYYLKNPFNTATPLTRPDFCSPFVTWLTGFHCGSYSYCGDETASSKTWICSQLIIVTWTSFSYDLNLLEFLALRYCFSNHYLESFGYITKLLQHSLLSFFPAQPKIFNLVDYKLSKELRGKVNETCKATGNPTPSVKWGKKTADGRHVPVTQWNGKNHTLRINSLQEEHYGDYVCLAENKIGNDIVVLSLGKCNCL